jgi:DNA-directed RNA polymerase specialized sigma24 family protein
MKLLYMVDTHQFQLRELSMNETAAMTGVSVAAAKERLFHGRRALRKAFTLKETS